MSVLSCYVPDFLFALARRDAGAPAPAQNGERPWALLGEDGRVLAVSPLARESGARPGMNTRQALARCPDLVLSPLDARACQAEHDGLLGTLAQTGLPVEAQDWGAAYVDLREVARDRAGAQALCADLGRQVRRVMGDALQPALGWDTGKFTARAASLRSRPGQMRLVSHSDEARFLDPLPITLLPLPAPSLQQLDWLGIRTLGRFGRLPVAAVQQRFGPAGKLAQQWAQGRDDRPVRPSVNAQPEPVDVDLDVPTTSRDVALDAAMRALKPRLKAMAARLEGVRRLRGELRFADGSARAFTHVFVEPVCVAAFVRAMLAQELERIAWPAELDALQLLLLDVAELAPQQLTLFPELDAAQCERAPFADLVAKLGPRYGAIFWRAQITDERHPLPERRFRFAPEA
jgi:nucleotidyltransferase/DNA polymerase involved in DNA repair